MNFCRFPPDRHSAAAAPARSTAPRSARSPRGRARAPRRQRTTPRGLQRVRASARTFSRSVSRRHRSVAEPLLRHVAQPERAPRGRRRLRRRPRRTDESNRERRVHSPDSDAIRAAWPLPDTPAMPTISPRVQIEVELRAASAAARGPCPVSSPRTDSATSPGGESCAAIDGGSAPIIRRARLASLSRADRQSPPAGRRAAPTQRCVRRRISSSLWLMNTTLTPSAASCLERAEQALDRLRLQHRGRLVEDQQAR